MTTRCLWLVGLFAGAELLTGSSRAQTPETSADFKQRSEQFTQAQEAARKSQASAESFRSEIEKLLAQQKDLRRQTNEARTKLAAANEKLSYYSTLGVQDAIVRWQTAVEQWEERLKLAEAEAAKVESVLHATVQAMQESYRQAEETQLILPGDSIEVTVEEDSKFNKVYEVRSGGSIYMDEVGPVFVVGMTQAQAVNAIKTALGKNLIRDATVTVTRTESERTGGVLYLVGEFTNPGPWPIPRGLKPTVVTTLVRYGWIKPGGDLSSVRVMRLVNGQTQVEDVNIQAILSGTLQPDVPLRGGDIIIVPAIDNEVYVTGRVVKPGTLKMLPAEGLTAYTAILRCGGFGRFANKKKVYVLRELGNGEKKRLPVNIIDVQEGKASDIILLPKDIVHIPEKFFSF